MTLAQGDPEARADVAALYGPDHLTSKYAKVAAYAADDPGVRGMTYEPEARYYRLNIVAGAEAKNPGTIPEWNPETLSEQLGCPFNPRAGFAGYFCPRQFHDEPWCGCEGEPICPFQIHIGRCDCGDEDRHEDLHDFLAEVADAGLIEPGYLDGPIVLARYPRDNGPKGTFTWPWVPIPQMILWHPRFRALSDEQLVLTVRLFLVAGRQAVPGVIGADYDRGLLAIDMGCSDADLKDLLDRLAWLEIVKYDDGGAIVLVYFPKVARRQVEAAPAVEQAAAPSQATSTPIEQAPRQRRRRGRKDPNATMLEALGTGKRAAEWQTAAEQLGIPRRTFYRRLQGLVDKGLAHTVDTALGVTYRAAVQVGASVTPVGATGQDGECQVGAKVGAKGAEVGATGGTIGGRDSEDPETGDSFGGLASSGGPLRDPPRSAYPINGQEDVTVFSQDGAPSPANPNGFPLPAQGPPDPPVGHEQLQILGDARPNRASAWSDATQADVTNDLLAAAASTSGPVEPDSGPPEAEDRGPGTRGRPEPFGRLAALSRPSPAIVESGTPPPTTPKADPSRWTCPECWGAFTSGPIDGRDHVACGNCRWSGPRPAAA